MALILVATADEGVLRPAASFGVDDAYQRAVAEILTSSRAAATMGLQALSGGRAIFSNDVLNDPTLLLRDDYHARGVRSMAALPLVVDGRPLGLFLLYAVEQDFFQDAEVELLAQLGDNIAFAVDHIEKIERIAYLARFDEGTGLANRSLFIERVAGRLAAARLADASNCLMVFDLERFKSINDIFGRDAGDSLLRQVAAWLMARIGDEARIARVGPDQFAVVTREFPPGDDFMAHLDADLIAFLAHPFRFNEAVFRLDMKAGLVVAPDDGQDAEVLLNHAEVALKQAKRTGTQRVVYDRQMSKNLAYRLALEGQMREAVEKNQFVLHYQPKISLTTGKLTGSEALIRWNDPRDGLTPPGRFIRTLEETGLIQQVGRWVLHTAIDDHTRWRAAGLAPGRVAVNVSPLQLRDRDFAVKVERLVGASSGLELEITESMIAEDIGNTADSLKRLRNNAVTIAIDDFGTGYSSLSHLAKLPVDTLKIDQTFIADMTLGPNELSLVSTIINLGHSLKLTVVAEGVESGEQARLLRLLGCDEMQGFLISAAVPPDEFASMYLRPAVAGSTA
jgi:diguanylate cyclase (GGDEF)-like protein